MGKGGPSLSFGRTFLAGVKKLVDQVRLLSDVAGKQVFDEKLGKLMSLLERGHQGGLVNLEKQTARHRAGRHHANGLACNASLTKETATVENSNDGDLALLGGNLGLTLPFRI